MMLAKSCPRDLLEDTCPCCIRLPDREAISLLVHLPLSLATQDLRVLLSIQRKERELVLLQDLEMECSSPILFVLLVRIRSYRETLDMPTAKSETRQAVKNVPA
jgi:hypothetical protein